MLAQLRAHHVTSSDRASPGPHASITKLRKEKEALAEEFVRYKADMDSEVAMLKRENESLKLVLNPVSHQKLQFT